MEVKPTNEEEQELHKKIKTKTDDIKTQYEQFEVLDDGNDNIEVKMDDDDSFAII